MLRQTVFAATPIFARPAVKKPVVRLWASGGYRVCVEVNVDVAARTVVCGDVFAGDVYGADVAGPVREAERFAADAGLGFVEPHAVGSSQGHAWDVAGVDVPARMLRVVEVAGLRAEDGVRWAGTGNVWAYPFDQCKYISEPGSVLGARVAGRGSRLETVKL